jgi:hypothetical protein
VATEHPTKKAIVLIVEDEALFTDGGGSAGIVSRAVGPSSVAFRVASGAVYCDPLSRASSAVWPA